MGLKAPSNRDFIFVTFFMWLIATSVFQFWLNTPVTVPLLFLIMMQFAFFVYHNERKQGKELNDKVKARLEKLGKHNFKVLEGTIKRKQ